MINSNRFCLLLLLLTLLCIIIGIFLVASSLRYMEHDDHEREVVSRRDVRNEEPLHKEIATEKALQRVTREEGKSQKEPFPVFPEDYHASGLLILPHSSIAEPFEIWYSNTLGASRIDYYYGKTYTILFSVIMKNLRHLIKVKFNASQHIKSNWQWKRYCAAPYTRTFAVVILSNATCCYRRD